MSIGNFAESAILSLVFQAQAWAKFADDAASLAETQIAVALHTADPGDTIQSVSETTYDPYSRVNVARSPSGWTLLGSAASPDAAGVISPAANISFPPVSVSSAVQSLSHFSVAGASGGVASPILWSGVISPTLVTMPPGLRPVLTQASSITLD